MYSSPAPDGPPLDTSAKPPVSRLPIIRTALKRVDLSQRNAERRCSRKKIETQTDRKRFHGRQTLGVDVIPDYCSSVGVGIPRCATLLAPGRKCWETDEHKCPVERKNHAPASNEDLPFDCASDGLPAAAKCVTLNQVDIFQGSLDSWTDGQAGSNVLNVGRAAPTARATAICKFLPVASEGIQE